MSAETAYSGLSPLQRLAAARTAAGAKMPYIRAALLALVPVECSGLNTLGVTDSMMLLWDPAVMMQWSRNETVYILLHEVWHVLREHADRRKRIQAEPQLWNLAADCEINDDLREAFPEIVAKEQGKAAKLPGIVPEDFDAKPGGVAEAYYHHISKTVQNALSLITNGPKTGCGQCGSGAGHALPNEPEGEEEATNAQGGKTRITIGRTVVEIQQVRKRVAQAVRDEMKKRGRGSIPGGWERWADVVLRPPRVRWQDKLARASRSAIAYRAGTVDWTYKKMSRRQAGIGYGAGCPILHSMHAPMPRVDVWVDTSGSMSERELGIALQEVRGILATGALVAFGAIDAEVQAAKTVRDWRELPKLLKGGGGTDFRPAFDVSAKKRDSNGERLVIFITDGDGTAPATAPHNLRVIWLLVGPRRIRPSWGEIIEIDDEEAA